MRKQKEPKTIVTSYVILENGSMFGTSMYRHHARREKILRLFKTQNPSK